MRREALKRLLDAFEAIASIERFIANCTLDQYLQNELIQAAVECQSKSAVDLTLPGRSWHTTEWALRWT
jgi:hypothetical protein